MPTLATPLQVMPDVVARQLPDGAVLVHLPSSRIFELNVTGARIWALIVDGLTGEAIVSRLVEEFDIDRQRAEEEVLPLLEELAREGLLAP